MSKKIRFILRISGDLNKKVEQISKEQQAYEELEIDCYHIVATLDVRTSAICQDMDGKVFKLSEYEPGTTAPPFHNYCRSATAPYFDDGLMPRRRWARDPETGKGEIIDGDIKYGDWKRSYVDKYGQRWWDIQEKMVKNETVDKRLLKNYRKILGKEVPRSLSKFQELKYNKLEQWIQLQDRYYVKSRLEDGRWTSIINPEKQAPHMESTVTPDRSYFYDEVNVQDIFDRYAGTGIVGRNYDGRRNNTETVILDRVIGVAVSKNRVVETSVIRIHYSAKRTHISPVFPQS
ncbi:polymorphic toxin type 50 domain-containing protein [Allofustis seminis]|uniref:polymorphic toxin type 50 domain-containing protein n=1 Tax=Allofustis seminis TaxID=166939 RepID=UPI0014614CCD|nr:polymorphic toxin type 50 domain-containing protein [Allofustis seminis]